MSNVTNTTRNPIALPGGQVVIQPGETVKVDGWDEHAKHPVVAAFVKGEALTTGGKLSAGEANQQAAEIAQSQATANERGTRGR